MGVADQVKKWRMAQKQRSGGMSNLSVWVTKADRDYLRRIFDMLANPETGAPYRTLVSSWVNRRRPVASVAQGFSYRIEIDAPHVGHSGFYWPIGGRIVGPFETWIELTPEDADEADRVCQKAIDTALEDHLREKGLLGKVVDRVGVACEPDFAQPGYPQGTDNIVIRPQTDEEFQENEDEIKRHLYRLADARVAKLEAPHGSENLEHILEFSSYNGIMSRCHLFTGTHQGQPFAAFGQIRGSLCSPTNHIEELARVVWRDKFPKADPQNIIWYDCILPSMGNKAAIRRVTFDRVSSRRFEDPHWTGTGLPEIPPVLVGEMLPLLRKSKRHPDFTNPEVFESLAIFWQMQTRHGILQFCSSECEMSDLRLACDAGDDAFR